MKRPPSALWRAHKPVGVSSGSLVEAFRRDHAGNFTLKVSHGGVLDPFASGVVVLLVGSANRLFEALHEAPKIYVAQVHWGTETDTGDGGGKVVHQADASALTVERLEAALKPFFGWTAQVPPPTSNKRVDGERAWVRAHRGEVVSLPPQQVFLSSAQWLSHELPARSTLEVVVRGGFYVRSLAIDLGRALGVGAHLQALHRQAIGPWFDGPMPSAHIGRELLPWLPSVALSDAQWGALKQGVVPPALAPVPPTWPLPGGFPPATAGVRAFHQDRLVALLGPGAPLLLPGGV